ncbi:SixA phosphatase family protein [Oceanicella actignis]|uniref:Phosphohistidine phosphatase n=1 Tax=Oceanicella actignis TaxID=1189325 RepID=A0A1M7SNX8_9RHOB|nr:histidine phosphatase family protein [Oceanicella actignis]SES64820.1 phosphohistidine phosphatase [Oceanicella actignis]SHN60124.1 phosphohistidine phosphatase [Oceanicella actignis]
MRLLILMRHGKSGWDDPTLEDHARPLALRGRLASALMGAWLRETGLAPEAARISDARRVRETWEGLARELPAPPAPEVMPELYHAAPQALLSAAQGLPDAAGRPLLLAHEPGLGAFLRLMLAQRPAGGAARALDSFPTAAVAALELEAPRWRDLRLGGARLAHFARPKDLV